MEKGSLRNKWQPLVMLLILFTSILVILFLRRSGLVLNVSAVETNGTLGVYWDAGCSARVISIDWGNMTPGQTKKVTFYIKNEGSITIFLSALDENWKPTAARNYIHFVFDSDDQKAQPNEVRKVVCSLIVSSQTTNVTNCSFDVLLRGTDYLLSDLNQDGKVDIGDINAVIAVFGTTPTSINWSPKADLNGDLRVDMYDLSIVCQDFGKIPP